MARSGLLASHHWPPQGGLPPPATAARVCTQQGPRHPAWGFLPTEAAQMRLRAPLKRLRACLFAESPGPWASSANPDKDNRPLINSPNLMVAQTAASPPALMSLIDWT